MADVIKSRRRALIGAGVIGSGWAARALAHGLDVVAWDPGPDAEQKMRANCRQCLAGTAERVGLKPGGRRAACGSCKTVEECRGRGRLHPGKRAGARGPEAQAARPYRRRAQAATVIIASSDLGPAAEPNSGRLQTSRTLVIGHPFNPVYLLPLVEVLGGKKTCAEAIDARRRVLSRPSACMPLKVRTEIPGFVADRLLEALWREALHMVARASPPPRRSTMRFASAAAFAGRSSAPVLIFHAGRRRWPA